MCVPELGRDNWIIKEGNGVPDCLLNNNPLSWAWFESTVIRNNGSVVQLEEQGSSKALVGGSNPSRITKIIDKFNIFIGKKEYEKLKMGHSR